MIAAVDTRLVRAHQWVVNVTGRQSEWLMEQCAYLFLTAAFLRLALRWGEHPVWLSSLMALLIPAVAWWILREARSPLLREVLASQDNWRRAFLVMIAVAQVPIALAQWGGAYVLSVLSDLAFLSPYYLACCTPPPPRPPKVRAVLQGGGA